MFFYRNIVCDVGLIKMDIFWFAGLNVHELEAKNVSRRNRT